VEYLITGKEPVERQKLALFSPDMRYVLRIMEDLDTADRKIVAQLAALLKERESKR
jgi:hypothetical protein